MDNIFPINIRITNDRIYQSNGGTQQFLRAKINIVVVGVYYNNSYYIFAPRNCSVLSLLKQRFQHLKPVSKSYYSKIIQ